jgi:hypothetical protein
MNPFCFEPDSSLPIYRAFIPRCAITPCQSAS